MAMETLTRVSQSASQPAKKHTSFTVEDILNPNKFTKVSISTESILHSSVAAADSILHRSTVSDSMDNNSSGKKSSLIPYTNDVMLIAL